MEINKIFFFKTCIITSDNNYYIVVIKNKYYTSFRFIIHVLIALLLITFIKLVFISFISVIIRKMFTITVMRINTKVVLGWLIWYLDCIDTKILLKRGHVSTNNPTSGCNFDGSLPSNTWISDPKIWDEGNLLFLGSYYERLKFVVSLSRMNINNCKFVKPNTSVDDGIEAITFEEEPVQIQ